MVTPNYFLKMGSQTKKRVSSFKWETHNRKKCGVHKMATPLGVIRVKLEQKLGKM